jgi:hypothetical protein
VSSELQNRQPERRVSQRYPIELNVRYRVTRGQAVGLSGKGKTVNMSRRGILLATDRLLVPGSLVRLELDWPIQRNDVSLNLEIGGQIVRSETGAIALAGLKILRHGFHAANDPNT